MDNLKSVYDRIDAPKVICAHRLPHDAVIKPYIYYLLYTSKVIVTDDYIRYLRVLRLRERQSVVQLWHGGGMFKKICLDAPLKMPPEEERSAHIQYSALLTSSKACVPVYAKAFGVSEKIVLPYGMPRTDKLINNESKSELKTAFFKKHPELKGKKIISYFPTFREKDGKRIVFDPKIDFAALDASLKDDEVFVIHRHPLVDYKLLDGEYNKVIDLSSCPSNELYCVSSLIVTDYSSIVFDACLLGVPMLFYCPDTDSYDRDLYIDLDRDLPGKLAKTGAELIKAISETLENPDTARVAAFREYHMGACDGNSSRRAADLVELFFKATPNN